MEIVCQGAQQLFRLLGNRFDECVLARALNVRIDRFSLSIQKILSKSV